MNLLFASFLLTSCTVATLFFYMGTRTVATTTTTATPYDYYATAAASALGSAETLATTVPSSSATGSASSATAVPEKKKRLRGYVPNNQPRNGFAYPSSYPPDLCEELDARGREYVAQVRQELMRAVVPVLESIVDDVGKPVVVLGSWPAQQIAHAAQRTTGITDGSAAPTLLANDIDVFYRYDGDGGDDADGDEEEEFSIIYSSLKYFPVTLPDGTETQINKVGITGYKWQNVVAQNDIGATGVAFEAYRDHPDGKLRVDVHGTCPFWRFLLDDDHVIRPADETTADAKVLIRIAYKAMQMGLPFDVSMIDPARGTLPNNIVAKIDELKSWPQNPIAGYEVRRSSDGKNAYELVRSS